MKHNEKMKEQLEEMLITVAVTVHSLDRGFGYAVRAAAASGSRSQQSASVDRVVRVVQRVHIAGDPAEVFGRVPGMRAPVVAADGEHSGTRLLEQ